MVKVSGLEFDEDVPDGFGPTVVRADDAKLLLPMTVWPRYVQLVDGCDRIPVTRAHQRGDDLAGTVRLTLERQGDMQVQFLGAGEVCVLGPLPSRWWGWRTRDGVPVLHPEPGDVDKALAEDMLTYDGTHDADPARGRRVLCVGGPLDGDELDTTLLEIDATAVLNDVGEWRRSAGMDDDAEVRHVYYRVRRAGDLDGTEWEIEAEDAANRAGWTLPDPNAWFATFEGERPWPGLLGWPDGWVEVGATHEAGPAGAERQAILDVIEKALLEARPVAVDAPFESAVRQLAEAALDAMLADPIGGHVQCEGEADPDDVLIAIAEGVDASYTGGADAVGVIQTALSVLRTLEASYTLHPRPGDTPS